MGVTNHLLTGMILQVWLLGDPHVMFPLVSSPMGNHHPQQTNTTEQPLSQAAASTTKKAISQAIVVGICTSGTIGLFFFFFAAPLGLLLNRVALGGPVGGMLKIEVLKKLT